MHRTNAQSTLVPDALAIIAACTGTRAMMELAVALRAIVTGAVLLPRDCGGTISRITADLMNPQWNMQAHLTLNHPVVKYFAKAFCYGCIQAVPLTPENPTRDLVWQERVKAVLERDVVLQSHAKLLLQQIKLRVTPVSSPHAPTVAAKATQSPIYDKARLYAKVRMFAEEFVRVREVQKARPAEANVAPSVAAPENSLVAAVELTPPVQPSSIAEPAPTPNARRVFRNAAAFARYASGPPIPSLCPADGIT
jgi:hypothetical protein